MLSGGFNMVIVLIHIFIYSHLEILLFILHTVKNGKHPSGRPSITNWKETPLPHTQRQKEK